MKRRILLALGLLAAVAGCPLPQPLPEYKEGQTVTPPRIQADVMSVNGIRASAQAVILVPAGCPTGREPTFDLSAQIHDTTNMPVQARWFVNYHPSFATANYEPHQPETILPNPDPLVLVRAPQPFVFNPYDYPPPPGTPVLVGPKFRQENVLRVVELVVSQGFNPNETVPPSPLPNRTPEPWAETQVYRWVFLTVAATPDADNCVPDVNDPLTWLSCVKCPPAATP